MQLRRPIEITFDRGERGAITVPPLTRAQIGADYALGSGDGLDAEGEFAWRGRKLANYLQHARCTGPAGAVQSVDEAIASLTAEEEMDIIAAVLVAQHGYDPRTSLEVLEALRAITKKKAVDPATPPPSSPSTTAKPAT